MLNVRSITLPISGHQFESIADRVHRDQESVVFTKDGRDYVVLMAADTLIALEETLALLADPAELAAVLRAQAEVDRGDFLTESQVVELLGDRTGKSN